jgi:Tfp pilus assembly protein, ATPase PilU
MNFNALFTLMDQKKASDLFITAGRAPSIKVDNLIIETSKTPLTAEQALEIILSIMNTKAKGRI